jgi:hypothetical protein
MAVFWSSLIPFFAGYVAEVFFEWFWGSSSFPHLLQVFIIIVVIAMMMMIIIISKYHVACYVLCCKLHIKNCWYPPNNLFYIFSHYSEVQNSFTGYCCSCKRLLTLEVQIIKIVVETKHKNSCRCLFIRLEIFSSSMWIRVFVNKFLCK